MYICYIVLTCSSKEIEGLVKKTSKGASISEDDIPPPVVIKTSQPIDPKTQTLPPPSQPDRAISQTPVQKFTAPVDSPVVTPVPEPTPTPTPQPRPTPTVESSDTAVDNDKLNLLLDRQKQFKLLALQFKQQGDIDGARKNLAISKVSNLKYKLRKLNKLTAEIFLKLSLMIFLNMIL
jgi:Predicted solute binding protein